MTHETYYKALGVDGSPCHGGMGAWRLPCGKRPGAWRLVKGELQACENGLHLCRRGDLVHWLGPVIYRAEARGRIVVADYKVVVAEARLVERLAWDDRVARLFAADCAERALMRERECADERCLAAVAVARRYANGEASDVELAAARAAAWAAAVGSARAATWAAEPTAWAAARAAAGFAAWTAARAAERAWQTDRLHAYLEGDA